MMVRKGEDKGKGYRQRGADRKEGTEKIRTRMRDQNGEMKGHDTG